MSVFMDFYLRMKARREKMPAKSEFKQAALTYVALKIIIITLTYHYVSCGGCNTGFLRHAIHLTLFTHFIWAGMRLTSATIAVICLVRGTSYVMNFFFSTTFLLKLPISGKSLAFLHEDGAGNFIFLINGILLYAIAAMIIRAVRARYRKPVEEIEEAAPEGELATGIR